MAPAAHDVPFTFFADIASDVASIEHFDAN